MKKEMVKDLPQLQEIEAKCKDCLLGEKHKEAIPKKA